MKGRRILVGLLLAFTLAVLMVLSLAVLTAAPALADQVGPYDVTYVGHQYDYPDDEQSTWYYTVTSTETCGAISHVTFGLEVCCSVVEAGEWTGSWPSVTLIPLWHEGDPEGAGGIHVGCDPPTDVCGIKFDEGFAEDRIETRNYYFTIEGNHPEVENVIKVAVKTGSKCAQDEELLPSGGLLAGQYSMLASEAVLADGDPMTYEEFIDGPFVDCGTTAIALSSLSATPPSGSLAPAVLIPAALLGMAVLAAGAMALTLRLRRQEL
jgi:hypothetical protein